MATTKFYLDTRRKNENGESKLKILFSNANTSAFLDTGITLLPEHWNGEKVIVRKDKTKMNNDLSVRMAVIVSAVDKVCGFKSGLKAASIRDRVVDMLDKDKPSSTVLLDLFERYIDTELKGRPKKTIESYNITHDKLVKYLKHPYAFGVDDVDRNWLDGFNEYMVKSGLKTNSRAIQLENIRAIINYAIREDLSNNLIFKRYTIPRELPAKRCLPFKEACKIFAYHSKSEYEELCLDMFRLMIMLCGINFIDLYNLKDSDVVNGRIEFIREKTKRHKIKVSIGIQPEMHAIISKWKGRDGHLLCLADRAKAGHDSFMKSMNDRLKLIGPVEWKGHTIVKREPLWPYLTTYYARHTAGTLLAELGTPIHIVAIGMGHSIPMMTFRYLSAMDESLDGAVRLMIDTLKSGKLPKRHGGLTDEQLATLRQIIAS